MNARLDLLASSTPACAVAEPAFACCPRYAPACDTAPDLFRELAVMAEAGAEALVRVVGRAARGASYPRA